ncbi:MAG: hypothetical protein KC910_30940 [Candidatus Eremiobacteraeota bacterium]|nr:hypothetical protein [Candidatus Eremiobacteraeota bacterium]
MSSQEQNRLPLEEAAELLRLPLVAVRRLVESGELVGDDQGVTSQALADFVGRPFAARTRKTKGWRRRQKAQSESSRSA